MPIDLMFDGVIAILVSVMIGYAAILNRRLRRFREAEGELRHVIASLTDATAKADASLARIKEVAKRAGSTNVRNFDSAKLEDRTVDARRISGDLSVLIEKGERLAERLTGPAAGKDSAGAGRRLGSDAPGIARNISSSARSTSARLPSAAERELIEALKAAR